MKTIFAAFARNTVFANIVFVLFIVTGLIAAFNMLRESFPEFSLDMITVNVVYPGADPEEVEEGISRKIEEALEGIEGIKEYTTNSSEDVCTAMIEVSEDYDVDEVLDKVRTNVSAISTFPTDAEKPVIAELTIKQFVSLVYLSGDMDERRLKEWAERIEDDLTQIPEISQVAQYGARDYEISIEVSEERLREYGLTLAQVAGAVRQANLNLAGGVIRTRGEEIRVRTVGRRYTGREFASIVVLASPDGQVVTLDRIATIKDGFREDPMFATINGEPSAMMIVFKTKEEDALAISKAVAKYVAEKSQTLPPGATIKVLWDATDMLSARINLLIKNGLIGLMVVFILLWMFLNARLSFWSGMGIPISIAGALALIWAMGGTINMISLFGLILVLGIVVDDAIVVGEAIFVHRKMGKPPLRAAVDGVCEVGMPVVAAVITTIVAFIPLAHVGGIMGKFIAIMPVVVISCLAVSLLECLFLLPAHLSHLPDLNKKARRKDRLFRRLEFIHRMTSEGMERFVDKVYDPLIRKVLQWRYVSLCAALMVLLMTIGLVAGGIVKFIVFPKVDGFIMTANIKFPNGSPYEVTRDAIGQIEEALLELAEKTETASGDPLLVDRLTLIGQTLQQIRERGPNVGSVQAILLDSEKRGKHYEELIVEWEKEIGVIPGVESLTFEGMAHGPPGAPIEVWLQGRDMDVILAASGELMERLGEFDGVHQITSDHSPGKNEMRLSLKPEARTLGLTVDDLARQIHAGYFGVESLRLQRGKHDIRVRVRYPSDERRRLSDIEQIRIRTATGYEVPLLSVADISYAPGWSTITRTNGMRRVAVTAEVDTKKANTSEIFAQLESSFFPKLKGSYPGLHVALKGEKKKMADSFGSLKVGFPIAVLGIFIIVATIFRSYVQPFIILFTVPFGIIGGIVGHLIFGYNLSMMSLFGMVALSGVVVNDAIVLIERINENLADGMSFFDAIANGGKRRFRAIFLTSLSTIGGLAPMIMETDFQARFLIPMAVTVAGGVAFATVLTLVLIPSLLVILNDFRRVARYVKNQTWPTREEVEPATRRFRPEKEAPETMPNETAIPDIPFSNIQKIGSGMAYEHQKVATER